MNKSFLTNIIAFFILLTGLLLPQPLLQNIGLFALSGAITNWLAIHMLFEKVPGLYGSGVIPNRFEEIKLAIRQLMMQQFFTTENIDRFLTQGSGAAAELHLKPVIEKIDLEPAFNSLVSTVMESSFGSMLGMFGGEEALHPLKDPFIERMRASLIEMTEDAGFSEMLKDELEQPDVMDDISNKISAIIEQRLNELTPQLVKQMVQDMIQQHLGWLVVWGGVFGGAIGLIASLLQA